MSSLPLVSVPDHYHDDLETGASSTSSRRSSRIHNPLPLSGPKPFASGPKSWFSYDSDDDKISSSTPGSPGRKALSNTGMRRTLVQFAFIALAVFLFASLLRYSESIPIAGGTSAQADSDANVIKLDPLWAPVRIPAQRLRPHQDEGKPDGRPFLPLNVLDSNKFTRQQCEAAFPLFAPEIDRTTRYWRYRGGIDLKKVKDAGATYMARALIYNGRLYVKEYREGGYRSRAMGLLASVHEAILTSPEPIPNVEFAINSGDLPHRNDSHAKWELTRHPEDSAMWLMPDFGLWSWPEPMLRSWRHYRDITLASEAKPRFSEKIDKLFWRGAILDLEQRQGFVDQSKKHPEWADVSEIDWSRADGGRVNMEEHCKYKWLASTEGISYTGRLKYLLMCRSVILTNELEWDQNFHVALDPTPGSPTQNIVYVKGKKWEGLAEAMDWLRADEKRAERIAENSWKDFAMRYLSPAATSCWWRMSLDAYASVQAFEPQLDSDAMDWESFSLVGKTSWIPW